MIDKKKSADLLQQSRDEIASALARGLITVEGQAPREQAPPLMTVEEARAHLERLGWTQGDFARFFEAGDRTARRWLSLTERLPIPRGVAFALTELTPAKVKKWMPE